MNETIKLFCVFAERDLPDAKELENHLRILGRQENVTLQLDRAIDGDEAFFDIKNNIECMIGVPSRRY